MNLKFSFPIFEGKNLIPIRICSLRNFVFAPKEFAPLGNLYLLLKEFAPLRIFCRFMFT